MSIDSTCPCGSGQRYAQCCQPCHLGSNPATATALMRSRYSAYVLQLSDYLLRSWHADTRPSVLEFDPAQSPRWLGLKIIDAQLLDESHASVEFVARFRHGGNAAQRLHERSRFVRENGRWFYLDGEIF